MPQSLISVRDWEVQLRRLVYVVCGIYAVFYVFGPVYITQLRYGSLSPLVYFIPLLTLLYFVKWSGDLLLQRLTTPYLPWAAICAAVMLGGIVVPRYQSVGFIFAMFLVTLTLARQKMSKEHAFLFTFVAIWLPIGMWEVIYNAGIFYYHRLWYTSYNLSVQEIYDLLWAFGGILTLFYLRAALRLSLLSIVVIVICFAGFTVWFVHGMPTGLYFAEGYGPFYDPVSSWYTVLVHASKLCYALPATLLIGRGALHICRRRTSE